MFPSSFLKSFLSPNLPVINNFLEIKVFVIYRLNIKLHSGFILDFRVVSGERMTKRLQILILKDFCLIKERKMVNRFEDF